MLFISLVSRNEPWQIDPSQIKKVQANIAKLEEELAGIQAKIDSEKNELQTLAKQFMAETGIEVAPEKKKKGQVISKEDKKKHIISILTKHTMPMPLDDLRIAYIKATGVRLLIRKDDYAVLGVKKDRDDNLSLKK